jgi:hypothetical protein
MHGWHGWHEWHYVHFFFSFYWLRRWEGIVYISKDSKDSGFLFTWRELAGEYILYTFCAKHGWDWVVVGGFFRGRGKTKKDGLNGRRFGMDGWMTN